MTFPMPNLHPLHPSKSVVVSDDDASDHEADAGEAPTQEQEQQNLKMNRGGKRPELFTHKATKSYTLKQQQELLNEFIYAEIEIFSEGKTVVADPANLTKGILYFWDKVAENATESPAFKKVKQAVKATTARKFCEEAVKIKKERMEAGEPHEPPFLRTGEGDSSDDEAGGENVIEENDGLNEQAPKKKSSKKPKNKAAATRPSNHDLKISWAIEVMLHAHVTKMQEREAEEMDQLPDDAEDKSSPKKGKKRAYDPPAKSEELADSSLHGPSKKMRQKSEGKEQSKATRQSQLEKHFEAQDAQLEMNKQMISCMRKSTVEEKTMLASAKCNIYKDAILEGIKLWREPEKPQQQKQEENFLTAMSNPTLIATIKSIGPAFLNATKLAQVLEDFGLDGKAAAIMTGEALKDLFTIECQLSSTLANILIAKLESWRLGPA